MRNVQELYGYKIGQEVLYLNPDYPTRGWQLGEVDCLDADEDQDLPFRVRKPEEGGYDCWVRKDGIRPLETAVPVLQYRTQTSATGAISGWRDVTVSSPIKFDYRTSAAATLEYVEIRVKPEFIPGWYQYVGADASEHEAPSWYEDSFPALGKGNWRRVDVVITPAE